MKLIASIVVFAIMASPSFAAPIKKSTSAPRVVEPAIKANSINYMVGLGLGTAGDRFHFGVRAAGLYPITSLQGGDLLAGLESGFLFGPGTITSWLIPIMAAGQYHFQGNADIVPYAGLSMGAAIFHRDIGTVITASGLHTTGNSTTSTYFSLLVKGGVFFGEDKQYFAELPLGSLAGAFAVFPSFGIKF